jgi:hypothetical protein
LLCSAVCSQKRQIFAKIFKKSYNLVPDLLKNCNNVLNGPFFQMKSSNISDVLKNDRSQLRSMYQPTMVKEQLQTLYREYDQLGMVSCQIILGATNQNGKNIRNNPRIYQIAIKYIKCP